jgi:hypothetical protein
VTRRARLVLTAFIDAFGWEIAKDRAFLDDELTVRQPLGTVFGYSSTCVPSVLTGLWPRDHGHFSCFYYDPARSPFGWLRPLQWLPESLTSRGRVRGWLSKGVARAAGYTGYFQLYSLPFDVLRLMDYAEKRDIYQPGGILSGADTVFDFARREGVPFVQSDWRRPEPENLTAMERALATGEPRFAYLYFGALDSLLHTHGTRSPRVDAHLRWYEDGLRRLLTVARSHYDDVRLHLVSDHGMTDIHATLDLMPRVEALGLDFGVDYVAIYDATMVRFWFLREAARGRITDALRAEPLGRWLDDEALAAWGCDFPDRRYGDEIFALDPGVLVCPSHMGRTPLAGMHGYAPDHSGSIAMYASNVQVDEPPAALPDVRWMLEREISGVHGARRAS